MKRSDDEFRLRVAPPRSRGRMPGRFTTRVLRALSKATGGVPWTARQAPSPRMLGVRSRGATVARLLTGSGRGRRRVVVKVRLVRLRLAAARSTAIHLRYLARDGVTRDGKPGQAYGPHTDAADVTAFELRGREDRHQFRLIVAPEDAAELDDLQAFTRAVMQQVESDLGTQLDWVAVDHWDTDNPHTHIVLRGTDHTGQDLVIAPAYVSHGWRARAEGVALEWLGPRTEREIEAAVSRDVHADRWTTLDRTLFRIAHDQVVNGEELPHRQRPQLLGRLQHLEALGLARPAAPGRWALHARLEPTLRTLGERGDLVRSMQRRLGRDRECLIHGPQPDGEVVGRVLGTVVVDDTRDRTMLLIDGIDGRAHAVPLAARLGDDDYPIGAIVRFAAKPPSIADRSIAAEAQAGLYRSRRQRSDRPAELADVQAMRVRRLEALRRAGIVERIADGVWRVPPDLVEQGRRYDRSRMASTVEVLSPLSIERQKRAIAATWLDQQASAPGLLASVGFGDEVRRAVSVRLQFLIEQGYVTRNADGGATLSRATLARLRESDVECAGQRLAIATGMHFRDTPRGVLRGRYRQALWLASGRFAMIEQQGGFCLVPWKPVLEGRLGQTLSVFMRGDRCEFSFHGSRAPSR